MANQTPQQLIALSTGFQIFQGSPALAAEVYLLAKIAGASTDPSTLANLATCFWCKNENFLAEVTTYLLSVQAGGSTDPRVLQTAASGYTLLFGTEWRVELYLICQWALNSGVVPNCDPQTLMANAKCLLNCLSDFNLRSIRAYLLCQIANNTKVSPPPALATPDLLLQDFESGVIPAGWVTESGAPNYGFVPALLGNFSLGLAAGIDAARGPWAVAQDEVFGFFYFRFAALGASALLEVRTAGAVEELALFVEANGRLTVLDAGGAHSATTVGTMTPNQLFFIWFHYKKGSGANAICSAAFSTTLSEPVSGNNFASLANGSSIAQVQRVVFMTGGAIQFIIDHVGIATFDMPNGW